MRTFIKTDIVTWSEILERAPRVVTEDDQLANALRSYNRKARRAILATRK